MSTMTADAQALAAMLEEFNATYHVAGDNLAPTIPAQSVRELRQSLLDEEYGEYLEASRAHDVVEVADALGDMAYILAGTHRSWGLTLDMPSWAEPTHRPSVPVEGLRLGMSLWLGESRANLERYGLTEPSITQTRTHLYRMLVDIHHVASEWGIPMVPVLAAIHDSNMSKLDPDGKPIFREGDGKVLKGPDYYPPDLLAVLTEAGMS